jgi:hypothetical protein
MAKTVVRPMYKRGGNYILAVCRECGRLNYCEVHGNTAPCRCTSGRWTEHSFVPDEYVDRVGRFWYVGPSRLPRPDSNRKER